jgi:hypothetical protein
MFRDKAPCAGKGCSPIKRGNAGAGHPVDALRVGLRAPMALLRLLKREMAISCEPCLAMNAHKPSEPDNIILKEY